MSLTRKHLFWILRGDDVIEDEDNQQQFSAHWHVALYALCAGLFTLNYNSYMHQAEPVFGSKVCLSDTKLKQNLLFLSSSSELLDVAWGPLGVWVLQTLCSIYSSILLVLVRWSYRNLHGSTSQEKRGWEKQGLEPGLSRATILNLFGMSMNQEYGSQTSGLISLGYGTNENLISHMHTAWICRHSARYKTSIFEIPNSYW